MVKYEKNHQKCEKNPKKCEKNGRKSNFFVVYLYCGEVIYYKKCCIFLHVLV